ncbi:MAG: ethyl tert-butyl ether degradation EthD [Sphingomonadales bacterium]|nr:ethyl tert-butyl ether degradation EthD [Sphingomonadales bacterium]
MITMIVFVTRKAGLSHDEFSKYWIEVHGPLVKSVPEFMKYVRKYVQHHRAPGGLEGGATFGDVSGYDGVGEIWFDDRASMKAAFDEPQYMAIIRPDEENFFDASRCLSFISIEHVLSDEGID